MIMAFVRPVLPFATGNAEERLASGTSDVDGRPKGDSVLGDSYLDHSEDVAFSRIKCSALTKPGP